jgi:peptidoglycan hydrolase CwlO-like protein|tara:strand:- start:180 stop:329 length:150 start_codon:yes stop_codon:yes gene_type:complete
MVSKEDMAQGYIEQIKSQLTQLKNQVAALEQHVKECEDGLSDESPPEGQ